MNTSVSEAANDYDAVPYESHPYWQSSPDGIGAIARLFGLRCAAPRHARVLELGCASGGNLIPHAVRNPEAQYLGVDYSLVQIEEGRRRIEQLGLSNIALMHASIAELPDDLGEFDYIIVHGVYSWVAPEIQAAILRTCKERLKPDGVAYVSYNVYPGWKTREIMRDAMLFHTRNIDDPAQRLGHARGMAEYMQQIARPGSMFKHVMDAEIEAVQNGTGSYLLHEYLEEHNRPCYFREFAAQALSHGLGYLGDGMLASMFPANLGDDAAQRLNNVAHNQVDLEQYMDFLSNRVFRQTLLVHEGAQKHMRRDLGRAQLEHLTFFGHFQHQVGEDGRAAMPPTWKGGWGGNIQPGSVTQQTLVDVLNQAFPGSVTAAALEQAVRHAAEASEQAVEPAIDELYAVVRALIARGMIRIRTTALHIARTPGELPMADWLARKDVEAGRAHTTSPLHEPAALNIIETLILPLLDGKHDHAALVEHLLTEEAKDVVQFHDSNQQRITLADKVRVCAEEHVALALQVLANRGLLTA